jgi:hypothetical protein
MHLLGTACCGLIAKYYHSIQLTKLGVRFFIFAAFLMWLFVFSAENIYLTFIVPMVIYYFGTGFIVASATASAVRPFPQQMALALAITLFCQFNCSAFFSFITSMIGIQQVETFMFLLSLVSILSFLALLKLQRMEPC